MNGTPPREPIPETIRLARALLEVPSISNVRSTTNHEPSWFLRTQLARIDAAAINGRLTLCPHMSADNLATSPGIVALWAPDVLSCVLCAPGALHITGAPANECDRCKKHADPIEVCAIAGRFAVVVFGLCPECLRKEVGA